MIASNPADGGTNPCAGANKKKSNEKNSTVHNESNKHNGAMAPQFPNGKNKIIMDTKVIEQYGEDILCYRLRTARQKKRMQYKDFDRQLIQLHKEQNALYAQKRNLGWEVLHPPVQKG